MGLASQLHLVRSLWILKCFESKCQNNIYEALIVCWNRVTWWVWGYFRTTDSKQKICKFHEAVFQKQLPLLLTDRGLLQAVQKMVTLTLQQRCGLQLLVLLQGALQKHTDRHAHHFKGVTTFHAWFMKWREGQSVCCLAQYLWWKFHLVIGELLLCKSGRERHGEWFTAIWRNFIHNRAAQYIIHNLNKAWE